MTQDIHRHRLLILDFGSQYTQLIARRIREVGVYCEIIPWDSDDHEIESFGPSGIILSGGPESVTASDSPRAPEVVFNLDVPVLGICYGMQTMAAQLGGAVEGSDTSEFGYAQIRRTADGGLFAELADDTDDSGQQLLDVWMSHGDKVSKLPPDFELIAETDSCPIAGMAHRDKPWFGIQFHPEVTHTLKGEEIFRHFVLSICGCEALWTPANIVEDAVARVREQVGDDKVLLGLSGGVDSSVVAALLHKAIGDQLTCVFVDTGLMRAGEADEVVSLFRGHYNVPLVHHDASDLFLSRLAGVTDPEQKRKIIGKSFIEVFDEEAAKVTDAGFLAQGTLYPDVIESISAAGGNHVTIKSHHNVGGLPEKMGLKLVEPLRELFKDEVRTIGIEMGLPRGMLTRPGAPKLASPFPV